MSKDEELGVSKLIRQMREHDARMKALTAPFSKLTKSVAAISKIGEPFRLVSERINGVIGVEQLYRPPISLRATNHAQQLARGGGVAEEAQEYIPQKPPSASSLPARPQPALAQAAPPSLSAVRSASDIGALVRTARKAMKLNQSDFAAHAGVGRRFVSELESGKGSLEFDKVLACASAAGIDMIARRRSGG